MKTPGRWPSLRAVKSLLSWSGIAWFWVVAFLVLPNCSLDRRGIASGTNLNPGALPRSSAIFCDIERNEVRTCSTAADRATAVRLNAAAVALNTGQSSDFGLDESPDALARCGGVPEVVHFQGSFPQGTSVCLNCGVIGPPPPFYADANAACVAKCEDLFSTPIVVPAPAATVAFCTAHAHTSANFQTCAPTACTDGGTPLATFVDPRRTPDPVVWRDQIGTSSTDNTLSRTLAPTGMFDAGAVSTQWIVQGDGYVEFSASENDKTHVIGLSELPPGCTFPCTDSAPGVADITYGISLNVDGNVYVLEGGTLVMGPGPGGSFGTYNAGERFRVTITDRWDSPRTITYSRIPPGACTPGVMCVQTVLFTHVGPAAYPLRVDASFRELATLTDVRIVSIFQ